MTPKRAAASWTADTLPPDEALAVKPHDAVPRLSILLMYFRSHANIGYLSRWKDCADVELLVNADSRSSDDLAWLSTAADRVVLNSNVHEIREYNLLARMARAPLVAFVQDDMPAPVGCSYVSDMESMFRSDDRLGFVGWRTFALLPYFHKWNGRSYQRRTTAKLRWCGKTMRAQYAAMADVGPLFSRASTFAQAGGFNERFSDSGHTGFYHDYEFTTRVWLLGWKGAYYDASYNLCFQCIDAYFAGMRRNETEGTKKQRSATQMRGKANFFDLSPSVMANRNEIMSRYKPFYDNITRAVVLNNERLGANCTWGYPTQAHAPLPPEIASLRDCCDCWGRRLHVNEQLLRVMRNVSNLC